jgi:hypothetical protein
MCIQKKEGSVLDLKIDGETPYLSKIMTLFDNVYQKVVNVEVNNGIATIEIERLNENHFYRYEEFKCNVNNEIFNNGKSSIVITKQVIKTTKVGTEYFDHVIVKNFVGDDGYLIIIPHICNQKDGEWRTNPKTCRKQFVCTKCGKSFSSEELNPFQEHPLVEKAKKELDQLISEKRSIKQKIRDKKNDIIKKRQITDTINRQMESYKGL